MYAVLVHADQHAKLFFTAPPSPWKTLKEQLAAHLDAGNFKLKSKLGDLDVEITNEEEFLVLQVYREGSGLPLEVSLASESKSDVAFKSSPDESLFWIGGIPPNASKDTVSKAIEQAVGGKCDIVAFEKAAGSEEGAQMALIKLDGVPDLKSVTSKCAGIAIEEHTLCCVPADSATIPGAGPLPVPKPKAKKKKSSRAKRASITSNPVQFKAWKAEYVRRVCKHDLQKISKDYDVQIIWTGACSIAVSGRAVNIKDARKAIDALTVDVQAFGQLNIPSPDVSFKVRVINQCRVLEKELGVVLMIDNLIESKEEAVTKVLVVAKAKEEFDLVRQKLIAIPKQMYEVKCGFSRKEFDAFRKIKKETPEKVEEIKKRHKIYSIKIFRGRVVLRGPKKDSLHAADSELRGLLPLTIPSPEPMNIRASMDGTADSFVPSESPRSLESSSKFLDIDFNAIKQFSPPPLTSDSRLSLDFPSPRDSEISSPSHETLLSPVSPDKSAPHETPEEEETFVEVSLELKEAESEVYEVKIEEDPLELDPDLPESWDPMPRSVNCIAALVEPDTEEFVMVKNSLDFKPIIKSIERIQNKSLYREFKDVKKSYDSESKSSESQYLWCGSMSTLPEELYDSDQGFKLQVDGQGAFQFWKKASYSNVFAYSTTDGSKQLFLAEVLTGGRSRMQIKNVPAYPAYLVTLKQTAA